MVAATGSRASDWLEDLKALVRRCTVRLRTPLGNGTGFFVAPRTILTCGHVVEKEGVMGVMAGWRESEISASGVTAPKTREFPCEVMNVLPNPCPETGAFPDLALLSCPSVPDTHPCVLLDDKVGDSDRLYMFGYPGEKPGGDEMTGLYEGFSGYDALSDQKLLKIKEAQVLRGASGSPVLNLRTRKICGMVKKTRDERQDLGGIFVPTSLILANFPFLETAQRDFHHQDTRWSEKLGDSTSQLNLAPLAPSYSVLRAEYARLKDMITGAATAVKVCAVQGLGGIGKSTLVLQAAHDPDIAKIFPDGVLWTSLSRETTPLEAFRSWIRLLEGRETAARSADTAAAEFRALLDMRRCLVIVDNLRTREDVQQFLPPNERSRLVFTTRRQQIADELTIPAISLDVMPEDLALKVVENTLGRPLAGTERAEAEQVINLVGRLPIALPMLSERAKKGRSWKSLNDALSAEIARLEALDPAGGVGLKDTRIEACFKITVDEIQQSSAVAYLSFCRLGLLPAGLSFSPQMSATVMGLEREEAADVLEYLWNEGLLTQGDTNAAEERVYRLHDLVHGFGRRLLSNRSATVLAREHENLLERYKAKCGGKGWHAVPPDGYIYERLLWHMERAGQTAVAQQVLDESADDGRNSWFTVREHLGEIDGYLRDVELAWKYSESDHVRSLASGQPAKDLHFEVERALQFSSVVSRDADYPPAMLAALFRSGTWSLAEAAAEAGRYAYPDRRVSALMMLASECGDADSARKLLARAVTAALLLPAGFNPAFPKVELARELLRIDMLESVEELLKREGIPERTGIVKTLAKENNSDSVLYMFDRLLADWDFHRLGFLAIASARAGQARSHFSSEARQLMNRMEHWQVSYDVIKNLGVIAQGQDKDKLVDQVLDGFSSMRNREMRRSILAGLAPLLNDTQRPRALELAREQMYPDAEIALLAGFDVDGRREPIRTLLARIQEQGFLSESTIFESYVSIAEAAPEWSDTAVSKATGLLSKLSVNGDLAAAIQKLAPLVPDVGLPELVEFALRIPRVEERIAALQAIASRDPTILPKWPVVELAEGIDEYHAVYLSVHLAPLYPEPERSRILSECARNASRSYYEDDVGLALLAHLGDAQARRTVFQELVKSTQHGKTWTAAQAFIRLARECPEDLLDEMLRIAMRCSNLELRHSALSALAPRLTTEQLRYFAAAGRMIGDDDAVGSAIAVFEEEEGGDEKFCPALSLPLASVLHLGDLLKNNREGIGGKGLRVIVNALARAGYVQEALQFIPPCDVVFDRDRSYAQTIQDLAPIVDFQLLWNADIRGKHIPDVLEPLLDAAPGPARTELALTVWQRARDANEWWQRACAVYARFLPEPERQQALDVAIDVALHAEKGWAGMSPHVWAWMDSKERELFARRFRDCDLETIKAVRLLEFAPYAGDRGFEEALNALSLLDKPQRAEVASSELHRFTGEQERRLRRTALLAAQSLEERNLRAEALTLLAVELEDETRDHLIVEAAKAASEHTLDRVTLLLALTPHLCRLAPSRRYEVYELILRSGSRRQRGEFLKELSALRFVYCSLTGFRAAGAVRDAISKVKSWWP